jgi:hypothetical protein
MYAYLRSDGILILKFIKDPSEPKIIHSMDLIR